MNGWMIERMKKVWKLRRDTHIQLFNFQTGYFNNFPYGIHLMSEKSGLRFSRKAFRPSLASSVI